MSLQFPNWDSAFEYFGYNEPLEQKKMTDQELNRWLHENVMGECTHQVDASNDTFRCVLCPSMFLGRWTLPDYCNSLDAVAKVEAKVIESFGDFGRSVYGMKVASLVNTDNGRMGWSVTATARQRAEACKEAWETK